MRPSPALILIDSSGRELPGRGEGVGRSIGAAVLHAIDGEALRSSHTSNNLRGLRSF